MHLGDDAKVAAVARVLSSEDGSNGDGDELATIEGAADGSSDEPAEADQDDGSED
jgi:hypothetical protein